MASGVDSGHPAEGERTGHGGAVDQYPNGGSRLLALTGSGATDDLSAHARGTSRGAGDIRRPQTLLNRAEFRPGQCIGVTSVMIGACVLHEIRSL